MKTKIILITAAVALFAAVSISAAVAGPSKGSRASVGVSQSAFGRILVDGRGHSLYMFAMDKGRMSSCYGACAANWPPVISSGKPRVRAGAKQSLIGRTKRMDGRWQVTYNGHPLYTFVKDTAKGQTNGEGLIAFGAEWDLVSRGGARIANDTSSGGGGGSTPPGGYGGYGLHGR
jgi:predicted lipoprotein with Yx(FWY)xxD motif